MKKHLLNIEEYIAYITLVIMTALAFANVVSRYVLHYSISFTEEITCGLLVLLCVMGTAIGAKKGTHLGLSIVTEFMKPKSRLLTAMAGNILSFIFCAILFVEGVKMVQNQIWLEQLTLALQWPEAIYGSFLPFGAAVMSIRFLQAAQRDYKKYKEAK
jgi:TRAP-type C4-dicarboxylate transport system permease small subunit